MRLPLSQYRKAVLERREVEIDADMSRAPPHPQVTPEEVREVIDRILGLDGEKPLNPAP